jgi:hypothetical protein
MSKIAHKTMNDSCTFHLDLTTINNVDDKTMTHYVKSIGELDFDVDVLEVLQEACEINEKGKLEIYIESEPTKLSSPDDFLTLLKSIDKLFGGLQNNSSFSWVIEFPYSSKTWEKNGYEWELIYDENDDYYEEDSIEDDWETEEDW